MRTPHNRLRPREEPALGEPEVAEARLFGKRARLPEVDDGGAAGDTSE